jgi:hypothetical protein
MVQSETVSVGYRTPLYRCIIQYTPYTLSHIPEAVFGLAQEYQTKTPETATNKERHSDHKNSYKYGEVKRQNLLLI